MSCLAALLMLLLASPVLAGEPETLKPEVPPPASREASTAREGIIQYTVQAGDTVYGLAKRFVLKPETIIWANEALMGRPDRLRVGQVLRILPVDGVYYIVRPGDTLYALAWRFGVTVQEIVRCPYNHIADRDRLRVGMPLIIPGAKSGGPVPRLLYYRGRLPADALKGTGTYVWPLRGWITQRFRKGHPGLDIGASKGTPVRAVDSGFAVQSAWDDTGYGHCIVIDHGNGVRTRYAHLSAYHVSAGESVTQGQIIGEVGDTGKATGPHLHLEIIVQGVRKDPLQYLPPLD
ncbi:MAG: M23 family metallopeptidase [Anaerolineae bacterium]|nr:M23 family metallopeptidase [Anaerolineae bacterium]